MNRLSDELDNATQAIVNRGHLYKWREIEFSWATNWVKRYFTLQGSTLSYYGEENERRPKRTIDLSRCVVRYDGTKKKGMFHVFSIYLVNQKEEDDGDDDSTHLSLLMRLSSDDKAEAMQWIDVLEQGCAVEEIKSMSTTQFRKLSGDFTVGSPADPDAEGILTELPVDMESTLTDPSDLSPIMLERVQSASESLKRVASKQTIARRVLAKRSPDHFTASGTRIDHLVDNTMVSHEHGLRQRRGVAIGEHYVLAPSFEDFDTRALATDHRDLFLHWTKLRESDGFGCQCCARAVDDDGA